MDSPSEGVFPDMPQVPALPNLRPQNSTPAQIISQMEPVLRSARDAVHPVECCAKPGQQLAQIRAAVVDLRRVTFVLQTLRGRVDGFDDWYGEVQEALRSDPLMRYFVELRNEIEKRGLPGMVAELYSLENGEPVADVACYEDEHGLAVSGAARPGLDLPAGELSGPHGLRHFRLPDPPITHKGEPLTDYRFAELARQALDFLESHVVGPARERFGSGEGV
jgi:hypothetical protein